MQAGGASWRYRPVAVGGDRQLSSRISDNEAMTTSSMKAALDFSQQHDAVWVTVVG